MRKFKFNSRGENLMESFVKFKKAIFRGTKKLVTTGVAALTLLLGTPHVAWSVGNEASTQVFTEETFDNHWGKSEVRAWLNGLDKSSGTLPIDGSNGGATYTNGLGNELDSFLACFTKEELGLFEAKDVKTNIFEDAGEDAQNGTIRQYTTKDRFWLPSGNRSEGRDQVISANPGEDISNDAIYEQEMAQEKAWENMVSMAAWASGHSWLRSPDCGIGYYALCSGRGRDVDYGTVDNSNAACPCAYLPLDSILFTSAVSVSAATAARDYKPDKIFPLDVPAFEGLGQAVEAEVPSWGMYLKLKDANLSLTAAASDSLVVNSSASIIKFTSSEAMKTGAYLCLQAFRGWDLTTGENAETSEAAKKDTAYYGVQQITQDSTTEVQFNLDSKDLKNCTVKVWLEKPVGEDETLAYASEPLTYHVKSEEEAVLLTGSEGKNPRVFAVAADLKPSLGYFSSAEQLTSKDIRVGDKATWQKLYIGTGTDGKPIEWWIAGRDDGDKAGLTLYQASANTGEHIFNDEFKGWSPGLNLDQSFGKTEKELDAFSKDDVILTYGIYDLNNYASEGSFFVEYSLDGETWLKKSELTQNGEYHVRAKFAGENMNLKDLLGFANDYYYVMVQPCASNPAVGKVTISSIQKPETGGSTPGGSDNSDGSDEKTPGETGSPEEEEKNGENNGSGSEESDDLDTIPEEEATLVALMRDVYVFGQKIHCILQNPNGVLPAGTQMRIDVAEPGSARWNELIGQLDSTHPVENIAFFEITLYDKDGNKLPMPLDDDVRVLLQIPDGWDKSDLEAILVRAGADVEFDEELETIDGVEYLSFWTDHFSPYAMIDKLTEAEKQELEKATKKALKTGEAIGFYAVLDAILLTAAGAMVLILTKKRKSI